MNDEINAFITTGIEHTFSGLKDPEAAYRELLPKINTTTLRDGVVSVIWRIPPRGVDEKSSYQTFAFQLFTAFAVCGEKEAASAMAENIWKPLKYEKISFGKMVPAGGER